MDSLIGRQKVCFIYDLLSLETFSFSFFRYSDEVSFNPSILT
ncbi:MAG: hypothetical protein H6Q13_2559 [Bacteroidetes bacterium]|jgi:hypothetical protein|nr:hypothetical protein [Bacteroidota bacterium]